MKKKALLLLTPLVIGGLMGCQKKETKFNVYFELNYSECPQGETISVKQGETVTKPTDPTRDGYRFNGWRVDSSYTSNLFDFKTPITETVTLYGSWVEQVTVTFDPQNNSQIWTESIDKGGTVARPTDDPTYENNVFKNWYDKADGADAKVFDFTTEIQSATTIYAHWTKGVSLQHNPRTLVMGSEYTFTYNTTGSVTSTSEYKFPTSDNAVVSINETTGELTLNKAGTAKITVVDKGNENASDTIDVTVLAAPEKEEYLKYMSFSEIEDSETHTVIGYCAKAKDGITEYTDYPETLVIPSTYQEVQNAEALPVLQVGVFTLRNNEPESKEIANTNVKNIVIPNSVTKINDGAFSQFKALISLELGNKVNTIGAWSFKDNNIHGDKNGAFHIPSCVESIWYGAFCSSGAPTEGSFYQVIFDDTDSLWKVWYTEYGTEETVVLYEEYNPRENPIETANLLRSYQEPKTGSWYNPVWEKVKK